jgi:hypothetical protein
MCDKKQTKLSEIKKKLEEIVKEVLEVKEALVEDEGKCTGSCANCSKQ